MESSRAADVHPCPNSLSRLDYLKTGFICFLRIVIADEQAQDCAVLCQYMTFTRWIDGRSEAKVAIHGQHNLGLFLMPPISFCPQGLIASPSTFWTTSATGPFISRPTWLWPSTTTIIDVIDPCSVDDDVLKSTCFVYPRFSNLDIEVNFSQCDPFPSCHWPCPFDFVSWTRFQPITIFLKLQVSSLSPRCFSSWTGFYFQLQVVVTLP